MDTLRLLVIDDDDVDRMQVKRALKNCGYDCELLEYDLVSGISDFQSLSSFDCIFLDYLLPGDNGLLLIKKIREKGIQTPVVIITSQGNESIAVELMKAGASDYLVKNDINAQSLGKVLRNILAMRLILKEREQAELALRISESRLAEAQRIAKVGNWEFDTVSNTFYLSDEAYKIIEIGRTFDLNIDNVLECVHIEDREFVHTGWCEILKGKQLNIDFRFVTVEGVKFANSQGYAAKDDSGKIVKIIGTLQDITERKLAVQEILNARELAEQSIRVREVFLANMSHEIRTPMNAILGFTSLLYETELTDEQKTFVDAISFSGANLLVVINDILDLSKIRSGKMSIDKCDFNLHELIASIVSIMSPKAVEKGLKLTHSIDQQIPSHINGDPVRLNQVLTNLIFNAIKFTQKGYVSLDVRSSASEGRDVLVEFVVKDTGIGIPEEMHAAIFDKFVQASNDTTRKYGGSGLGLTIVKSLLELQDGKISLTSNPDAGSTFLVRLPFQRAQGGVTQQGISQVDLNDFHLEELQGTVVLVAEDNAVNQLLVRKVLEKAGCEIDFAANGVEALTRLRARDYDIVLMDIQMPEMDGYEATRQIRKDFPKPLSEIPIIAMTAHAFGSDVIRCLSAGMNDYISKPFKAPDLYARMSKHVRKKNAKIIALGPKDDMRKINLSTLHQLGRNDTGFIEELILVYDRQTPAFVEKLKTFVRSRNYDAIKSVCHQIQSSYGIVKMQELDEVLLEMSLALADRKSSVKLSRVGKLVEVIISLIMSINDQVKYELKKTG